jgi:hypothetical protein
MAKLQSAVYKYPLLLLHDGSCLFCTVGGSHRPNTGKGDDDDDY